MLAREMLFGILLVAFIALGCMSLGRAEVVRLLLDTGTSASARGRHGRTPLNHAAKSTSVETVRLLLDAGAPIDAQGDNGATPLRLARTTEISELPISRGADVNHLSGDGWTPLMAAGGAADCADLLLIVGADPNPHTREGRGPLSLAAGPGTAETIATRGGACHVPAQETDLRFTVTGLPAAEAVSERQWWET